jgi:hypothetical protein
VIDIHAPNPAAFAEPLHFLGLRLSRHHLSWRDRACTGLACAIVVGFVAFFAFSVTEGISKQSVYTGSVGFWLGAYLVFAMTATTACLARAEMEATSSTATVLMAGHAADLLGMESLCANAIHVTHPLGRTMRSSLPCLAMALGTALSACAHGSLPLDVQHFVDRRDTCDHFRGEIPDAGDRERMDEVRELLSKYCNGTDAELAALRTRYPANRAVIGVLSAYETKIEATKR